MALPSATRGHYRGGAPPPGPGGTWGPSTRAGGASEGCRFPRNCRQCLPGASPQTHSGARTALPAK